MTNDEIMELADECGLAGYFELDGDSVGELMVTAFAKMVAAKEQDKICRQIAALHDSIMLASHATLTKRGKA